MRRLPYQFAVRSRRGETVALAESLDQLIECINDSTMGADNAQPPRQPLNSELASGIVNALESARAKSISVEHPIALTPEFSLHLIYLSGNSDPRAMVSVQ